MPGGEYALYSPRRFFRCVLLLVCCWVPLSDGAIASQRAPAPAKRSVHVLWIGNSYTGNGRLWELVTQMVNTGSATVSMTADRSVHGGKNFKFHYEETDVLEKIRTGGFDYVVLQNQSLSTLSEDTRGQMAVYTERLVRAIRAAGAEPVFYCTWARAHRPETQATITRTYWDLAVQYDAVFSPVGPAWQAAREARPDIVLHSPDRSHPGAPGVYLTACVMYAVFTGESPVGHANRTVEIPARNDETGKRINGVETVTIGASDARFLQRIAWETVRHYAEKRRLLETGTVPTGN